MVSSAAHFESRSASCFLSNTCSRFPFVLWERGATRIPAICRCAHASGAVVSSQCPCGRWIFAPHLRAFAVIAGVADHGRILLRCADAASYPKKKFFIYLSKNPVNLSNFIEFFGNSDSSRFNGSPGKTLAHRSGFAPCRRCLSRPGRSIPAEEGGTAFDSTDEGVMDASAPGFGKGVFERIGVHACGAFSSGGA